MPSELRVLGIGELPEMDAGADVGTLIAEAAIAQGTPVEPGDVVVVAHKIVSKAEGRLVAAVTRDDARAAARREARRIVRDTPEVLIAETRHGFVCANAGVDRSNVRAGYAALLPKDPDASASRIRTALESRFGEPVAVIVSDTFGRAWRVGQTNVAIGCSGIAPVRSHVGEVDPEGKQLAVTEIVQIDELAAAAELVMGKLERVPVAVVRGYRWERSEDGARSVVRPADRDLFR